MEQIHEARFSSEAFSLVALSTCHCFSFGVIIKPLPIEDICQDHVYFGLEEHI